MIVKVQISIITTEEYRQVLIYNKDRSFEVQMDATSELVDLMDGELKKFFHAHIDVQNKKLNIDREAPWQEW